MSLDELFRTQKAIRDVLREERTALLCGDAAALEATISRLGALLEKAGEEKNRTAASLFDAANTVAKTAEGTIGAAEKKALLRLAAEVRLLARANARLLVEARDLTRALAASFEGADRGFDRSA